MVGSVLARSLRLLVAAAAAASSRSSVAAAASHLAPACSDEGSCGPTRMAWFTMARSNAELVASLKRHGIITSHRVEAAMTSVDRGDFCPSGAYVDSPQPIGYNATISAPHMHAYALEALSEKLRPGAHVLDVGFGSGYLVAAFCRMVDDGGKVVGIEHVRGLAELGEKNLRKHFSHEIDQGKIKLVVGDGRDGYAPLSPYDAIHVGAAAEVIPQALVEQLAPNGRMFIPVGPEWGDQYLTQVDKDAHGHVTQRRLMGVRYVPLTDAKSQWRGGE